jgi:copper chaperone CopZ
MPTLKLCVGGMRSRADEARIEERLRAESGIYGAVANHEEGAAEVDFDDDEVDLERILELVRALGYEAALGG